MAGRRGGAARRAAGADGGASPPLPPPLGDALAHAHWRPGAAPRGETAAPSRALPTSPRPRASGQPRALVVAARSVTSPATRAAQRARVPSRCAEPRAPSRFVVGGRGSAPGMGSHLTPPSPTRRHLLAVEQRQAKGQGPENAPGPPYDRWHHGAGMRGPSRSWVTPRGRGEGLGRSNERGGCREARRPDFHAEPRAELPGSSHRPPAPMTAAVRQPVCDPYLLPCPPVPLPHYLNCPHPPEHSQALRVPPPGSSSSPLVCKPCLGTVLHCPLGKPAAAVRAAQVQEGISDSSCSFPVAPAQGCGPRSPCPCSVFPAVLPVESGWWAEPQRPGPVPAANLNSRTKSSPLALQMRSLRLGGGTANFPSWASVPPGNSRSSSHVPGGPQSRLERAQGLWAGRRWWRSLWTDPSPSAPHYPQPSLTPAPPASAPLLLLLLPLEPVGRGHSEEMGSEVIGTWPVTCLPGHCV